MPKGPQGQQRPSVVIGKDVHIALIATGKTQELELNRHSKSKSDLAKADARFDNTAPGKSQANTQKTVEARWS